MELEIIDTGYNGEGIAKADGKVCFVPFALLGEIVDARVIKENGKFNDCEIVKILQASKERVNPPCPYFSVCGGCDLQHINYENQLKFKKNLIKNTFLKIANKNVEINDVIKSDKIFNYRNKMAFECGEKDKTILGMYKKNSHDIVEIKKCLLAPDEINNVIDIINKFINEYNISAYDEKTKTGLLRNVVIRKIENTLCIILVVTSKYFPKKEILIQMLPKNIQLFLNINNEKDKILSTNFELLYGPKTVFKTEFGITYPVSPFSFMQVNDNVKEKLYNFVLQNVKYKTVIDAYSGAGLMSAIASKKSDKVIAVEISRSACRDANLLMKNNNIQNVEVINADCGEVLGDIIKDNQNASIILDPPRSGVDKNILKILNKSEIKQIIYISCNPKTLARDLMELENFKIELIQPFDMFPETAEVETVAILSK